jgi:hypothetical protein
MTVDRDMCAIDATKKSNLNVRFGSVMDLPGAPERLRIVGILNVTPDSFSDGGRWLTPRDAASQGVHMHAEGADLIDVGGESTRPGAFRVSEDEELRRILPVGPGGPPRGRGAPRDGRRPRRPGRAAERPLPAPRRWPQTASPSPGTGHASNSRTGLSASPSQRQRTVITWPLAHLAQGCRPGTSPRRTSTRMHAVSPWVTATTGEQSAACRRTRRRNRLTRMVTSSTLSPPRIRRDGCAPAAPAAAQA